MLEAIKCTGPCWLLLDELNLAPAEVLAALVPLIDGSQSLSVPGVIGAPAVQINPQLQIIATQNPANWQHGGRKPLPPSLLRRFLCVSVPEYEEQEVQ